MPRIALVIEYDGSDFFGWQTQQQEPTLQAVLEAAASRVAAHPVELVCAGRTDTGVHARAQVAHFDTSADRPMRGWALGINANVPGSVAVRSAHVVDEQFHARYSARRRAYRYRLLNRPVRPALDARFAAWELKPLDVPRMHAAAQVLIGEHDFTSFRTIACQARSPRRLVTRIEVSQPAPEWVEIELEANAFLHHMCRNIVGSLLKIGRGEADADWLAQALALRDRRAAGVTAPARGLCFLGPRYPQVWGLPAELSLPADFVDDWRAAPDEHGL